MTMKARKLKTFIDNFIVKYWSKSNTAIKTLAFVNTRLLRRIIDIVYLSLIKERYSMENGIEKLYYKINIIYNNIKKYKLRNSLSENVQNNFF